MSRKSKRSPITPQIFQEVIDELENNPKWAKYKNQTTIDWLQKAIKRCKEGLPFHPEILRKLLGCRKRILNDTTEYRNVTVREKKAKIKADLDELTKIKNDYYFRREEAKVKGDMKAYEKYKKLHQEAMQRQMDYYKDH